MLNMIPGIGWILDLMFKASLAVPFWFIWTICGIGATYFYWLPKVYQTPGFWDCVGVFIVVPILKGIFIPTLASLSNNKESKDKVE